MAAPVLTNPAEEAVLGELLRPERRADGTEPEQRVVYSPVSWDRYLAFDRKLGDDRPGPRLYFLAGELEIMTTSIEHERIKKWIAGFMDIYFEETRTEVMPRGQATMRLALKQAGAEPDESWCIGEEKEFPDLVLEIALTSGGINKLEIYGRLKVPEVWVWNGNKLEIFVWTNTETYQLSTKSRLFPNLDMGWLERCVPIHSWQKARQTFRSALSGS